MSEGEWTHQAIARKIKTLRNNKNQTKWSRATFKKSFAFSMMRWEFILYKTPLYLCLLNKHGWVIIIIAAELHLKGAKYSQFKFPLLKTLPLKYSA